MKFGKAESPDPVAYAANSRLVTASADCRISVRRTQNMEVCGVLLRGLQVFLLTPNAENLCGSTSTARSNVSASQ
jgi:hypothetical protein